MTKEEFLDLIIKIKDVSMATVSLDGKPKNRIIDIMYKEDNKLYFLTARGKSLYQELMNNSYVSISTCVNKVSFVLNGYVRTVSKDYLDILFKYNDFMYSLYPGDTKNILEVFEIYDWEGEYFDLNSRPIVRESFNNQVYPYYIIKDKCISCGKCLEVCPQKCIDIDNKTIIQKNCLHCGACLNVCPKQAIEVNYEPR